MIAPFRSFLPKSRNAVPERRSSERVPSYSGCETKYEITYVTIICGENETLNNQNKCVPKSKAIEPQESPDYDFGDYYVPPPPRTPPPPPPAAAMLTPVRESCGEYETLNNQNKCVPKSPSIRPKESPDYFGDYY